MRTLPERTTFEGLSAHVKEAYLAIQAILGKQHVSLGCFLKYVGHPILRQSLVPSDRMRRTDSLTSRVQCLTIASIV
jgi:hypothetical protein